jgi:hypothetical protein
MQVFVFQSERDADVAGFTVQRDGGNLPSDFAPWRFKHSLDVYGDGSLAPETGGADAVLAGIRADGSVFTF